MSSWVEIGEGGGDGVGGVGVGGWSGGFEGVLRRWGCAKEMGEMA